MLCILVGQGENANCSSLRNMVTQGLLVDALKVQCTCHATVDNASAMRWLSRVMFYHCLHRRVKCECLGYVRRASHVHKLYRTAGGLITAVTNEMPL